jgi:hypothetical protein
MGQCRFCSDSETTAFSRCQFASNGKYPRSAGWRLNHAVRRPRFLREEAGQVVSGSPHFLLLWVLRHQDSFDTEGQLPGGRPCDTL